MNTKKAIHSDSGIDSIPSTDDEKRSFKDILSIIKRNEKQFIELKKNPKENGREINRLMLRYIISFK